MANNSKIVVPFQHDNEELDEQEPIRIRAFFLYEMASILGMHRNCLRKAIKRFPEAKNIRPRYKLRTHEVAIILTCFGVEFLPPFGNNPTATSHPSRNT